MVVGVAVRVAVTVVGVCVGVELVGSGEGVELEEVVDVLVEVDEVVEVLELVKVDELVDVMGTVVERALLMVVSLGSSLWVVTVTIC